MDKVQEANAKIFMLKEILIGIPVSKLVRI